MELKFLGKDSGFGENNNSAYYETENKLIMIDCGFSVFNIAKKTFDFNKYKNIEIIITHLHNDHAGSLSQLILYLWFVFHKKTTIFSKCEKIKEYLDITGTPNEAYELKSESENLEFIKTQHVKELDSYGFKMLINGKNIIYTGDTATLEPFIPYFSDLSELYLDVSITGGVHIKINDILNDLILLKSKNIKIFLMHFDNNDMIKSITNNEFFL